MKQIIQDLRSGSVDVVELPDPAPRGNQVLVRTAWSLISPGTEQALAATASKSMIGKALERPDQVRQVIDKASRDGVRAAYDAVQARLDDVLTPGYSSSGVVEAVGPDVIGITPGMRVGCVGANSACHAELAVVPAPLCLPLPDGLDDRWGAFGAVGAIAAHGVRIADVDAGSTVAVIGLGLIGQLAVQLVTAAGARAIGVDISNERVELARRLGAVAGSSEVADVHEVDALVRAHTDGHGADAVVITAATKDSGPVRLASEIARDRATISVVGLVGLEVPRDLAYEKELQIRVSRSYGPGRYDPDYEERGHDYPIGYVRWPERRLIGYFLDEVAADRIRLHDLVTHEFEIARGVEAYEALEQPGRMAILIRYPGRRDGEPIRRAQVGKAHRAGPDRPRVGLIGPGLFARSTLLPQLAKLDVELSAVVAPTGARAFGVARKWGGRYVAADPQEVLADESIDVVVIATRHDSHARLTAQALENGKAVFLEKPLAIGEDDLALVEPLLQGDGKLVVDFNRGFSPSARQLIEHFAHRVDPLHIHYRVNAGSLERSHWLRDPAVGGGRLVGEGCHFIDFCSALIGQPLAAVDAQQLGAGPVTLPGDSFVLNLRYADGSLATVSYIATGAGRMPKERVEVLGGGRSAVIEDFRRVELFGARRRERSRALASQDKGHAAALASAFRFFSEGGSPPIPYQRLLETTRASFAARAALSASAGEAGESIRG
jgi:predicted dehydrogenase